MKDLSKKKIMLKKHSALVQTNTKELSLIQRKTLNYFIYILQRDGCKDIYEVSLQDVKNVICESKTQNKYIKEQLKKIPEITVEYNYLNKDKKEVWGVICIVPYVHVDFGKGTLKFEISRAFQRHIMKPYMYVPLNIIMLTFLKCKYSLVLYEFLRDYLTAKRIPLLTIEEIRTLLGVHDHMYYKFKDFRKHVLDKAVYEINEKTDVNCFYELYKEHGNKYSSIQFFIEKSDSFDKKIAEYKKGNESVELELIGTNENLNYRLPDKVKNILRAEHQTVSIVKNIWNYIDKGENYIVSNIKYVYAKGDINNFGAYLKKSLVNDYGEEIRLTEESKKLDKRKYNIKNRKLMNKILIRLENQKNRPSLSRGGGTITAEDMELENLKGILKIEAAEKNIDLKTLIEQKMAEG